MKKYLAELVGTFTLVFFGCGAAAVAGAKLGTLGIAFAFGLSIVAMIGYHSVPVIVDAYMYLRPGPRLGQVLLAFAKALHPEAKW